jgi:hypothetical protein
MDSDWDSLLWLLLLLGPLLVLQRSLHRNNQAVFLLITRRPELALALFSLLFFPAVLLHESSHFIVARLLGVRTGRFSLIPRAMPNGKLQLGYVETAKTDIFRDALIGAAPLLAGSLFVAFAGLNRMGLGMIWEAAGNLDGGEVWAAIEQITSQPDFWLWFYLTFTVSSTMLPSASDRRAWPSIAIVLAVIVGLALISGAGPWMAENLAPLFDAALQALDIVLLISVIFHLLLLPLAWILHRLLEKLTGMQVA